MRQILKINQILEDAKLDRKEYEEVLNNWEKYKQQFLDKLNFDITPFKYTYGFIFGQIANHVYKEGEVELRLVPFDDLGMKSKLEGNNLILIGYTNEFNTEEVVDEQDFLDLIDAQFKPAYINEYMNRSLQVKSNNKSISDYNSQYLLLMNEIEELKEKGKQFKGTSFNDFWQYLRSNTNAINVLLKTLDSNYKSKLKKRLYQFYSENYMIDK